MLHGYPTTTLRRSTNPQISELKPSIREKSAIRGYFALPGSKDSGEAIGRLNRSIGRETFYIALAGNRWHTREDLGDAARAGAPALALQPGCSPEFPSEAGTKLDNSDGDRGNRGSVMDGP